MVTEKLFNVLASYCGEKKISFDKLSITKTELNEILKTFYVEVRRVDGTKYRLNSFRGLRNAVQRKFKELRGGEFDVINSIEFNSANMLFNAECVRLKREGLGKTSHHPPLIKEDCEKLYSTKTLSCENHVSLQRKVFFNVMLHFCRRGQENLRQIRIKDFEVKDSNGTEMVTKIKDELTKNRRENDESMTKMLATG